MCLIIYLLYLLTSFVKLPEKISLLKIYNLAHLMRYFLLHFCKTFFSQNIFISLKKMYSYDYIYKKMPVKMHLCTFYVSPITRLNKPIFKYNTHM